MTHEKGLKTRELRRKLWLEDPHCHWCGIITRWLSPEGGKLPEDAATIDHLYTRYEMEKRKEMGNPCVLACNKCNHDLGEQATAAQPIEELWRRAGQYDRMLLEGRINEAAQIRLHYLSERN
jgi:hypothetical protein